MVIGLLELTSGEPIGSQLPSHRILLQHEKRSASNASHSFDRLPAPRRRSYFFTHRRSKAVQFAEG